jgi:hypothetical protein
MVQSLGVRIGPASGAGTGAAAADSTGGGSAGESASKCPFAGMIPGLSEAARDAAGEAAGGAGNDGAAAQVEWTAQAQARLEAIPSFVRPMARTGIERFALERGYATVDERVLDEARDFFGM